MILMERVPELVAWHQPESTRRVALILPGGFVKGRGRYWKFVETELRDLARQLAAHGAAHGLAVYLLRYRCRGWNGDRADTLVDARWALDTIKSRHGGAPIVLIGNSLGGRAAFLAAGDESVVGVVGVAPWLPGEDPIEQLTGRKALIIHGDRDRSAAAARLSLAYAEQARTVVPDLARLEVRDGGHHLVRRAPDCWSATTNFVLGVVGAEPWAPAITIAMTAAAPDGLRTPLPTNFADHVRRT
jgi:pimeloyl-ACP methyl ester carboxylesterase